MANIRSANEIILSLIDFFKLAQADLDTKPGSVARDLVIEAPAAQLSLLYDELSKISNKQSLRLVIGSDLDKLGKNYGLSRRQASPASGVPLLTFSSINSPININAGDTVIANNGFAYSVTAGISVLPAASNFYKSTASKFRDQLDFAGISDQFAVEVTVVATTAGSSGNIGSFSLSRTNIAGVSNVTNINPFTGGSDQETDASFRNRILSSFSGSSVGTALGYLNVALGITGVSDAFVVQPGDPLMTRDGTISVLNSDGSRTIISEGSGGKVDVVVLGTNLIENINTFIFIDKSNINDPTSSKNNIVLGQIAADINKTVNRKRIDDIANGVLPIQPVNEILEVTGSKSGSNFIEKSIDSFGRVSGNYELLKDTGVYAGSPWGFDTFHWISNKISLFNEDLIKGQFNGQDAVTFTEVIDISQIQQNISITNENSIVTTDRSIIQLLHTPATNVTRVFNVQTGERYIITSQNLDQTGTFNTTGRIQISGNTLPSSSDSLQVDYSWVVDYDSYSDYDGLQGTSNSRAVTDSIDWGFASQIKEETITFVKDAFNNFFIGTASHPISSVISANRFLEVNGIVKKITSGIFINRFSVTVNNLLTKTNSINFITFKNTNTELFNTAQNDGTFISTAVVVGIQILFDTVIILPSDTIANDGDKVSVFIDYVDVFHINASSGSSNNTQITLPTFLITDPLSSITLKVTYIANISDLFSIATTSLPVSRSGNGLLLGNNNGFSNFSQINISRRENQIIQKNTSNQLYIELNLLTNDFILITSQVISIVRLSDGKELWNSNNIGTIVTGISGNYQLIFNGLNTPAIGDRVIIIYYATDIRRFQPFSYENLIIRNRIDTLTNDPNGKLFVPINKFTNQLSPNALTFTVFKPNTNTILFSVTDGYLTSNNDGTATLASATVNFSTLPDLTNQKIKISNSINFENDGIYDIVSYNILNNHITITNILDNISPDQISIIRILDGKEIWNYSGTIDKIHNEILIPSASLASVGDKVFVMFFKFKNLRQSPTKLIGTIVDQVSNAGTITINGSTIAKATDIVFTATNTGLKLNLSEAIRKALNLSSVATIPNNIKISSIVKMEKVITVSSNDDTILEVLNSYDLKNTTIQNNLLYNNFVSDSTLQNLDFILPSTSNNLSNVTSHNLPTLGDKIRITFYYTTDNDTENLSYTKNGALYTNKKFAIIDKSYVSSGLKSSQSAKFTASSFTQPNLASRYKVFYDYLAPKQNERILIRYNFNKLISDATFALENNRIINADVLARQAKQILLDLTMNVVISSDSISSTNTILQNLKDQLISAMTTTKLGQIVDAVTLINIAQSVSGIDRARILYFNKTGIMGQVSKIQAQEDEYFSANNIILNTETR